MHCKSILKVHAKDHDEACGIAERYMQQFELGDDGEGQYYFDYFGIYGSIDVRTGLVQACTGFMGGSAESACMTWLHNVKVVRDEFGKGISLKTFLSPEWEHQPTNFEDCCVCALTHGKPVTHLVVVDVHV